MAQMEEGEKKMREKGTPDFNRQNKKALEIKYPKKRCLWTYRGKQCNVRFVGRIDYCQQHADLIRSEHTDEALFY
jgi:hypothetical protein